MTLCKHCHLEIRQIVDPWGHTSYRGRPYEWYHVAATENNDGQPVYDCPDGSGERAERAVPRCQARIAVKMPYDSIPDVAVLQCEGPEDHDDDKHEFEHIPGGTYGKVFYRHGKAATA